MHPSSFLVGVTSLLSSLLTDSADSFFALIIATIDSFDMSATPFRVASVRLPQYVDDFVQHVSQDAVFLTDSRITDHDDPTYQLSQWIRSGLSLSAETKSPAGQPTGTKAKG